MFTGAVFWRGIVFTTLMLIGKLVTGIWLIRIAAPSGTMATKIKALLDDFIAPQWSCMKLIRPVRCFQSGPTSRVERSGLEVVPDVGIAHATDGEQSSKQSSEISPQNDAAQRPSPLTSTSPQASVSKMKSRSLYPASIVGTAMMARGEIGFLIAALAQSRGIFAAQNEESGVREDGGATIYLVVVWAIALCTVIGPVSVGLLVRRVKKLQLQRRERSGGEDPLGIWGVL